MKVGDRVGWTSGIGHPMQGIVVEAPPWPGASPLVRESRLGTMLRPRNATVITGQSRNAYVLVGHDRDPREVFATLQDAMRHCEREAEDALHEWLLDGFDVDPSTPMTWGDYRDSPGEWVCGYVQLGPHVQFQRRIRVFQVRSE